MGMYLAPKASEGYNKFNYKYFKRGKSPIDTKNLYRQINDKDFIYVSSYNSEKKTGYDFTLEHYDGNKIVTKINASKIEYIPKDTTYRLYNYVKRHVGALEDSLEIKKRKDTLFSFNTDDLTPEIYAAEVKSYPELVEFIRKEEARGSSNIGRYKLVLYRKWSLPVSIFILTIIAVAVSSIKRRGGMGVNLALGITIAMVFVFFDKIFGVMAQQSDFPPIIAVWFPNFVFSILAVYLLRKAKR
jgi:lipopolysaccharide export system permease protein